MISGPMAHPPTLRVRLTVVYAAIDAEKRACVHYCSKWCTPGGTPLSSSKQGHFGGDARRGRRPSRRASVKHIPVAVIRSLLDMGRPTGSCRITGCLILTSTMGSLAEHVVAGGGADA